MQCRGGLSGLAFEAPSIAIQLACWDARCAAQQLGQTLNTRALSKCKSLNPFDPDMHCFHFVNFPDLLRFTSAYPRSRRITSVALSNEADTLFGIYCLMIDRLSLTKSKCETLRKMRSRAASGTVQESLVGRLGPILHRQDTSFLPQLRQIVLYSPAPINSRFLPVGSLTEFTRELCVTGGVELHMAQDSA